MRRAPAILLGLLLLAGRAASAPEPDRVELRSPETVEGLWAKTSSWAQQILLDSPNLCRLLMSGGLILELFAILALCGRRIGAAYGAALIIFHVMVRTMTGLNFRFHMAAIFIFLILPLLISLVGKRRAACD